MKRFFGLLMCAGIAGILFFGTAENAAANGGAEGGADQNYTIKFSYIGPEVAPEDGFDTMYSKVFKEYVEANSNGQITVEIYPAGQLGNFTEMIQGTMSGSIEVSSINVIPLNSVFEKAMIFGMPGAFRDIDEANVVFNSAWAKGLYDEIQSDLGVKVLSHYTNGFRHFTNSKRLVKTVEDAKGLTFRTMESPVSIRMVEAMGAKAVPIPSSEMYVAMQNGVVDGQENPISAVIQDLTYEVQSYMVLDGHFASSMMIIMNDELFSKLPANLQTVVLDGAAKAQEAAIEVVDNIETNGLVTLAEKGMEVYSPTAAEKQAWHDTYRPAAEAYIRDQLGDADVDSFFNAIEAER